MIRPALMLAMLMLLPHVASAAPATASSPAELPPPPAWLAVVEADYSRHHVDGLSSRIFTAEHWWEIATPLLTTEAGFEIEPIGYSAEGRPLRHVHWGDGPTRVLLWSQMHGDESTASMALADLFRFLGQSPAHPLADRLRRQLSLHVVPILNPDGAARFQRRNAQGIDINRDAAALASPEARALKMLRDRLQPAFGFNLHDQRPGYRVGDSARGTAIALLAPPFNEQREVNDVRGRAIGVSALIRAALEPRIGGHIARWDDEFNPRAFGDLMTYWGTSTVLIESGGIEGDPQKQKLRKLNFLALLVALDAIASGDYASAPHALYTGLPENGDVWPDLLIRGATLASPGVAPARADILVEFEHALSGEGGRITDIGDLGARSARTVIDARDLYLTPVPGSRLVHNAPARFALSRDPEGLQVVWSLLDDLDTTQPMPENAGRH
ncbi:M14 family zinc carboxypeptidase [Stenotrophomonas pictorum]|nr:M14 family zinc carboxypeptidase [Stenotrophomonas pictorum]